MAFIVRIIETMKPRCTKKPKVLAAGPGVQDPGRGKQSINYWSSLSDEVVLFILRFLPQQDLVIISLVNRRFRHLSKDPSLWTKLTLDFENIKQNVESCRKLVDRCKKLASINITNNSLNCGKLNIMTVVTRAKESLKSLEVDLSMKEWTPAAMAKLGSLKNLTWLSLSVNSDPKSVNSYIGANMLKELANLDQLEVLNLAIRNHHSGYDESFSMLETVFQQLKKLKEVKLFPAFYDESLVVALAENNPDLKVLHGMTYSSLSDRTVDILVNSCPGFEKFIISSSHSESQINKLSSSWPKLKYLGIVASPPFGSIEYNDEKLIGYVEKFRSLEALVLCSLYPCVNVTDSGIERLVGSAEKLKLLILRAPQVTKDLVKRLRIEYPDLNLRINNY